MTKFQSVGYIRVSTLDQNIDRQLEGLTLDKKFIEYASGKDTNRSQLKEMIDYVREGDTIYVHSMDRLARNLEDLLSTVKLIVSKKVNVHFSKENLTFSGDSKSPISELLLSVLGAIAQFERSLILDRQREGIRIAQQKGKYKGRKKKLGQEQLETFKKLVFERPVINGKPMSNGKISRDLGISAPTFYKYLKEILKQAV